REALGTTGREENYRRKGLSWQKMTKARTLDTRMSDKARQREDFAALMLAHGVSKGKTAKAVGIAPSTLYRWQEDPAFRQKVKDFRTRLTDELVGQLVTMGGKAIKRLGDLLASKDEPIALQAIREWRAATLDLGTMFDLAERIQGIQPAHPQAL